MIIGKLENRRRHLGLRQTEVAKKSGLSDSQLSQYVNYKSDPGLKALFKWASALGLELDVKVKDDDRG